MNKKLLYAARWSWITFLVMVTIEYLITKPVGLAFNSGRDILHAVMVFNAVWTVWVFLYVFLLVKTGRVKID